MTEFKKGDRVRVEFEGEVMWGANHDGEVTVVGGGTASAAYVKPEHLTLIAKPLEAGDVITWPAVDNAPDMEICAIVTDKDGVAWQKHAAGRWFSGGSMPKNSLTELARTRGPLTVRYVP